MALRGIKVIEIGGLAPVPFCGMVLADFGARVITVDSPATGALENASFRRGKEFVTLNLKDKLQHSVFRRLCSSADVLVEPFRPGVMERLSLGPRELFRDNPRLIFARLTGFGQIDSPMKQSAGHDINYLALSGVLSTLRKGNEIPVPPVNIIADFAGGGLSCAFGIVSALFQREKTGRGQVVDCSMTEGAAYVSSFLWLSRRMPIWGKSPGYGLLDGGSHFYRCYRTKDNKFMAVGALEPKFYSELVNGLGLTISEAPQFGSDSEALCKKFQDIFNQKTRDEWTEIFQNVDACVTPVLELDEAAKSDISKTSNSFVTLSDSVLSPFPAPRLSDQGDFSIPKTEVKKGESTRSVLKEHGVGDAEIDEILAAQSKL